MKTKTHTLQEAYRIVEIKNGVPHTLFHGIPQTVNGKRVRSRKIPLDTMLHAERKPVTDGTSDSVYESGFNVLLSREHLETYMRRFTKPRDLRIVSVLVNMKLRRKSHSNDPVYLADRMILPSEYNTWLVEVR